MDIELTICLYIRRKIYFKELTHLLMEATKYKTHTLKDAGLENRRRVKVLKSQESKSGSSSLKASLDRIPSRSGETSHFLQISASADLLRAIHNKWRKIFPTCSPSI